jgi:hypothetical protein
MNGKQWLGLLAPLRLTSCSLPGANQPAQEQAARKQLQQQAHTAGMVAGHQATVHCLRSERGQTDGSELRCEAWGYVQANYPEPQP